MSLPGLVVLLALVVGCAVAGPATGDPPPEPRRQLTARAGDDTISVEGERDRTVPEPRNSSRSSKPTYLYKRMAPDYCGGNEDLAVSDALCVAEAAGATPLRTCQDGTTALAPLFRRPVDPLTGEPAGGWSQVDLGGCPEDPPAAVVVTETDFRALPLTPSPVRLQPVDGHGLVNVEMILVTDPDPQVLTTTILGVPVTVTATPASYAWDLGDGSAPIVTTDPGATYPNQTVTGVYTRHGDYVLTLTTTWTGTYRVAGAGPQLPVVGTAVTVSAPVGTHIHEAHSRLVANP